MPRPKQCRRVGQSPDCTYFKPAGVPTGALGEVVLTVDELESLRLADLEGLYHEQAAERMGVSRRTFGRIIDSARKKTAEALIRGMALRIEGGVIEMAEQRTFRCDDCGHQWQLPFGTGRPDACPQCASKSFRRAEEERGRGGKGGARRRGGTAGQQGKVPGEGRRRQRRRGGAAT